MEQKIPPGHPMEEFWTEQMKDPEFVSAYQGMEAEFQAAREVIRLRLQRGLSQRELAVKVGTRQSGISRLERASVKPSLSFLQRVAEALNAKVVVHLVPREGEFAGMAPALSSASVLREPTAEYVVDRTETKAETMLRTPSD